MRKPLRTRLGLGLVLSGAIGAWLAACGGSDAQDVIDAPDTGPAETSTVDTSKPDTGSPDTGKPDTGPVYDAGPPNVLDGGDLYEGGVPCVVGGLLEEEPNDDRDAANVVDPTRCGAILLRMAGVCATGAAIMTISAAATAWAASCSTASTTPRSSAFCMLSPCRPTPTICLT